RSSTRPEREKPVEADRRVCGRRVLKAFREDLRQGHPQIEAVRAQLLKAGFELTPVRILEILVWTETEMNGYYRLR
ncbi:MAG: hypothetical protein ACXVBB_08470, partial [Isosphaeraceae bacterium]